MNTTGNRLLLVFLFCSVFFFAVALIVRNDGKAVPDEEARRPAMQEAAIDVEVTAGKGAGIDPELSAEAEVPVDPEVAAREEAPGQTFGSAGEGLTLGSYDFDEPVRQLKLPNRLREVSGLAVLSGDRLLAHDDEKGTVVEIDYREGSVVKDFRLGGPRGRVADDFEGIAAADGLLYLVSSSGRLYEFGEGADGATVSYKRHETGVGRFHEIEGLAHDPDQRVLLLVSKNPRNKGQGDQIAIYRWSIDTRRLVEDGRILIEASALAQPLGLNKFQPSGIERHPVSGNYFVVAARQRAIAEITPRGTVLAVSPLKAGRHRQAEGISFASNHTLVIADEGAGKRATLSFYPVAEGR